MVSWQLPREVRELVFAPAAKECLLLKEYRAGQGQIHCANQVDDATLDVKHGSRGRIN